MEQNEVIKDLIESIKNLAIDKGLTVSVAESLTSGNIQSVMASVTGSSKFFVGGVTAYNIDQKVNLLGVRRQEAEKCNCVSSNIANQMAVGCLEMFGSDLSIAITGYSEPYDEKGIETPFCYYAIGYKGTVIENDKIESISLDRNLNRQLFTQRVIQKLYEQMKKI
jgi:nicotinamide-nucleotide amidase